MKTLATLVDELERKMPYMEQRNELVSQVQVGWHIEHSLLAFIKMISAVEHSDPANYKWRLNIRRTVVLLLDKFPRGRAQAPQAVRPGEVSKTSISGLLEKAKQKAELFEKLNRNKFFTHPVFGDLRLRQARRIIAIHTGHHIKIINDILK